MIRLLALLFLLQEPPLDDLLQGLRGDSIAEREKAAAEIVKRGEPALKALREELGRTGDAEVRSRIGIAIGRILREKRRREFKGGPVVAGLSAALTVEQDKKSGDAVFKVEIMNVDVKRRDLVPLEVWDYSTPFRPEKAGVQTRYSAAQGRVFVSEDPPKSYPDGTLLKGSMPIRCGTGPSRKAEGLEPGESRTYAMTLKLDPGGYKARVWYYSESKKLLPDAAEDLPSNYAEFRID